MSYQYIKIWIPPSLHCTGSFFFMTVNCVSILNMCIGCWICTELYVSIYEYFQFCIYCLFGCRCVYPAMPNHALFEFFFCFLSIWWVTCKPFLTDVNSLFSSCTFTPLSKARWFWHQIWFLVVSDEKIVYFAIISLLVEVIHNML